ncbi:lytic transglycosylase domain-containing protein [Aliivibrio fischeri]|uniref:lytic transglycosylase domain-containing protein n=1 Tax=Aliivibrio fischeri TaxID=668 RepID=UPI00080DF3B1|nr:lytic transglycosylase domain-containing protein [Aliivibrio fischeri]OCH42445.1 murein transglycosylase [Aliivibrio fischeri]
MKSFFLVCACALTLCLLSSETQAATSLGGRSYDGWSSRYTRPTPSFSCPKHCAVILKNSQIYGVPRALILAVIRQESNFNTQAVSSAGAKGLMQLMDMNSRHINPFNVEENIQAGTALLSRLLTQYDSIELALAAYNAGEGNVKKYGGIPPFKETQDYIKNVMTYYRGYQQ